MSKETTIPFGASDSELMEAAYFIPQGYHAVIEGNKVIIKKYEQNPAWSEVDDDDAWMNDIISKVENKLQLNKAEIDWLKSLKDRIKGKNEGMIEVLRTEYEKGRADVIAKACQFLHDYQEYPDHDISLTQLMEAFKDYLSK